MSDPENFLTRWSRRKQQAESKPDEPDIASDSPPEAGEPGAAANAGGPQDVVAGDAAGKEKEAEVDLSTLPSLDTIGADTDVRGFLQKGVPLNLTRAALSRAWTSDPAISNFIGIAENQWDFASGDIPGFGPLTAADNIARMVSQITTEGFPRALPKSDLSPETPPAAEAKREEKPADEPQTPAAQTETDMGPEPAAADVAPAEEPAAHGPLIDEPLIDIRPTLVHREENYVASQHFDAAPSESEPRRKRLHGRALPQ